MTDAKFKQLVNSFLDREISQKDHLLLAREIASSAARRQEFERYRRLHAAERQALAKLFANKGSPFADEGEDADGGHPKSEGASSENAEEGIDEERRAHAAALRARAARAWSEVQLLAVERRKRLVLIGQFSIAGLAILMGLGLLYRQSVQSIAASSGFRQESEAINTESNHLAYLRACLRARQSIRIEWRNNERGEPVAFVGRSGPGGMMVLTGAELPQMSSSELAVLMEQLQRHAKADAGQNGQRHFAMATQADVLAAGGFISVIRVAANEAEDGEETAYRAFAPFIAGDDDYRGAKGMITPPGMLTE